MSQKIASISFASLQTSTKSARGVNGGLMVKVLVIVDHLRGISRNMPIIPEKFHNNMMVI